MVTSTEPLIKNTTDVMEYAPTFENDIDPIQLLEELDVLICQLTKNPNEQDIARIDERLQSLQIITLERDGESQWVTAPFLLQRRTIKHSMSHRIMHLIKTGGEWRGEYTYQNKIQVQFRTVKPLSIAITSETKNEILNDSINSMLMPLAHIHKAITDILETGASTIGIFEKPYGVVAMNQTRAWLESKSQYGPWEVKNQLEVNDLSTIISKVTFSVEGN